MGNDCSCCHFNQDGENKDQILTDSKIKIECLNNDKTNVGIDKFDIKIVDDTFFLLSGYANKKPERSFLKTQMYIFVSFIIYN